MSWYSSGVACLAMSLTPMGSTVRAPTTATRIPDPSDMATLHVHSSTELSIDATSSHHGVPSLRWKPEQVVRMPVSSK